MIRLTCDNCEKPIDVGDEMAGQKVKCPECGDINLVPSGPRRATAPVKDRAAEAGYPPAIGPEVTVMRVRRAMFRAKPIRFMLLFIGAIGGLVGGAVMAFSAALLVPGIGAGIVGVACAGVLAFWKLMTLGEKLMITNKRTVERTGILSKFTTEVRHQDIRNIQVSQSFHERMFKVGRIGISSAGQDGLEIVADDIPNPDKVREVIDLYRSI